MGHWGAAWFFSSRIGASWCQGPPLLAHTIRTERLCTNCHVLPKCLLKHRQGTLQGGKCIDRDLSHPARWSLSRRCTVHNGWIPPLRCKTHEDKVNTSRSHCWEPPGQDHMHCKPGTQSCRGWNILADITHSAATRVTLGMCRLRKPRSLTALQVAGKCPDRMVGMGHHRPLKQCLVHKLCKRRESLAACQEGSQSGVMAGDELREPQATGPLVDH